MSRTKRLGSSTLLSLAKETPLVGTWVDENRTQNNTNVMSPCPPVVWLVHDGRQGQSYAGPGVRAGQERYSNISQVRIKLITMVN